MLSESEKRLMQQNAKLKKKLGRKERLKDKLSKIGTLNIILVIVFLIFLWFNYRMIEIYQMQGSIPETYACAVVAALLGECGFCGWIRTNKDRKREHDWEVQERKEREEKEGGIDDADYRG